jgi:hypothetical protein
MMINPPYLELAYYVGASSGQEQGLRLAEVVLQHGARLQGDVDLMRGDSESAVTAVDLDALRAVRRDGLVRRIRVSNATGLTARTEVIEVGEEIVLLRTEGRVFSGPAGQTDERGFELGEKVASCFKHIASAVEAPYGAICVEYSLETPTELAADSRSLAFRNFFLSRGAFGSLFDDIRRCVGEDSHVEELEGGGLYVSMSPEFNPDHRAVEPIDAQYRSVRVAELLLRHLRIPPS